MNNIQQSSLKQAVDKKVRAAEEVYTVMARKKGQTYGTGFDIGYELGFLHALKHIQAIMEESNG